MRRINHFIILSICIIFYALLYIGTRKDPKCEEECQKLSALYTSLTLNRNYVYGVYRCTYRLVSDSLCVYVKDTTGINWNLFADTVCIIATSSGLPRQKIFILNNMVFPPDTLARKDCP